MRKTITIGIVLVMVLMGFVALASPIASDTCGDPDPEPVIVKTAEPYCGWFSNDAVPLGETAEFYFPGRIVRWYFTINITNTYDDPMTDVVVKDRFGGELKMERIWHSYPTYPTFTTKGASEKVFMEWVIGTLAPGESAELFMRIATDTNPAGKQEYTSPGEYDLNSGATIKYFVNGEKYSMSTGVIPITVIDDWEP